MSTLQRLLNMLPFAALAAALTLFAPDSAQAQAIVASVNGNSITSYDVDQRMKLVQVTENRRISRGQAIEDLIDDRLKLTEARRIGLKISEDDIDNALVRAGGGARKNAEQLLEGLRQRGVESGTLRDKFRADIGWSGVMNYRTRSGAPSNDEINRVIEERVASGKAQVVDYVLYQVIFIVPNGSGAGMAGVRQRDAEAARGRFTGCEAGLEVLRQMRDVAVKAPVSRSSNDLNAAVKAILEKTPEGKLTSSFRTDQGIEMLAVCDKRERIDRAALRPEVEAELSNKKVSVSSQELLKELRSKATITRP
jgi:peptidyl-prolyl cis-trans isomerase SurA